MGIILTLLFGALAGWLASLVMNRDHQQKWLLNIVVGIVGAFLGNLLLEPVFGIPASLDVFSVPSFLVSVGGAVILLAILNFAQRGELR